MTSTGIDTWQVAGLSDVMGFEMSIERKTRMTIYFAFSMHVIDILEDEILKLLLKQLDIEALMLSSYYIEPKVVKLLMLVWIF